MALAQEKNFDDESDMDIVLISGDLNDSDEYYDKALMTLN